MIDENYWAEYRDTVRDNDLTRILTDHGKDNDWLNNLVEEVQGLRNVCKEQAELINSVHMDAKDAQIVHADLAAGLKQMSDQLTELLDDSVAKFTDDGVNEVH